jgi:hypothetical protein
MSVTKLPNSLYHPSRRRVVRLVAAASGLALAGAIGAIAGRRSDPEVSLHRWQGTALGADASLLINIPDAKRAKRLISLALAEIDRLERVFKVRPETHHMFPDGLSETVSKMTLTVRRSGCSGHGAGP